MGKNQIIVHVPDYTYFGGDVIHGVVELNVSNPIKSRGVRLVLHGYEDVKFDAQVGSFNVTLHEKNIFLQYRMDLAGAPREDSSNIPLDVVQSGVYRWPFAIKLPDLLAPSVTLKYGTRIYRCGAYVDIPHTFDLACKTDVRVGGNISNPYQYLSAGPPPAVRKNYKGFIFGSGKLHMTSLLVQENFFVGDTCYVKVIVDNQSSKNVERIQLALNEYTNFYACGERHIRIKKLHKQKFDILVPPKSSNVSYLEFVIPEVKHTSTSPSVITGVKLIEVRFGLVVKCNLKKAMDLKTYHEIQILRRDPKFVHGLPPIGPSVPMTKRAFYIPPFPPTFAPPQPEQFAWQPSLAALQSFYGTSDGRPPFGEQPHRPFSAIVSSPNFTDLESIMVSVEPPSEPDYTQPEYQPNISMNYPAVDGYDFPQNTAIVAVGTGAFQADEEEESLLK